jgi:hypothetical protein
MKFPSLPKSFQTRLSLSWALGLATLAGTVAVWLPVRWMLAEQGGRFSRVFGVLLHLDLAYLPWFVAATLLALVIGSRARRLVLVIESFSKRPWLTALVTMLPLAALAPIIYQAHPLAMDEYAAHFQSQVFAAGKLTGHFPPEWMSRLVPPWFQGAFLVVSPITGDVASVYWPSFALLMAPFSRFDLGWLCNPVLTAISVAALMLTMRRLLPSTPEATGWAAVFALASPVFLALGVSYYAMTALMLANLIYIWGFLSPRPATLFWSGVVGSIALTLHNPLPHLLFALPWIFWLIRKRGWGRDVLALLAGYLPLTLLLGIGWLVLRGQIAGSAGAVHETEPLAMLLGLAVRVFVLPDWGVFLMRTAGFAKLWLWAMPGLVVLAALGWWQGRRDPYVSLLAQSALLTFVGYLFVPFDQGHGWGYRYFHSAWLVLPLLAARYVAGPDLEQRETVKPFAAALVVFSLLLVIPLYLLGTRQFVTQLVEQLPPATAAGPLRLTFVYPDQGFYSSDLVQNDPFLRGDDVRMLGDNPASDAQFAKSLSPEAIEVARAPAGIMWQIPTQTISPIK